MSLPQVPVRVRFPNRYTGGYYASTFTDKVRWQTISCVKQSSRPNGNSNMGGEPVIAKKAGPCCPGGVGVDPLHH